MKKRIVAICLCAVLLLGVVGTMAYFTDNDSVVNTFTVGKVSIDLNESDVDNDNNTKANHYKLLPGSTYVKDPTVSIDPDSEDAYIRMIVTVKNYEELKKAFPNTGNTAKYYAKDGTFLLQMLCNEWDKGVWQFEQAVNGKYECKYEFRYKETVGNKTDAPKQLEALFKSITVPGEIDNKHLEYLEDVEIHIEAHAIQVEGFENADKAWEAFSEQTGL